jgi:hypothetical protein
LCDSNIAVSYGELPMSLSRLLAWSNFDSRHKAIGRRREVIGSHA